MAKDKGIHIVGPSLKPWIRYLEKLENEPTAETQVALNALLDAAFEHAKQNIHPITRRLLTSGFSSTSHKRLAVVNRWTGTFSFGRGVPYAKYEFGEVNARRGPRVSWPQHPSHDPSEGLDIYYAGVDAILDDIGK